MSEPKKESPLKGFMFVIFGVLILIFFAITASLIAIDETKKKVKKDAPLPHYAREGKFGMNSYYVIKHEKHEYIATTSGGIIHSRSCGCGR